MSELDAICEDCATPMPSEEILRCEVCGHDGMCDECWTFGHETCRESKEKDDE